MGSISWPLMFRNSPMGSCIFLARISEDEFWVDVAPVLQTAQNRPHVSPFGPKVAIKDLLRMPRVTEGGFRSGIREVEGGYKAVPRGASSLI